MAASLPLSLNRNRSPGCSALNSPEPEGCQKLASSGAIPSRKLNQGLCVTPTNILTTNRSEEHTSELQSLMRISYAVFCLKKKKTDNISNKQQNTYTTQQ